MIASLLLLPTFIVGLYGQNFATSPSCTGASATGGSWGLIIGTTALQLVIFRRKGWIGRTAA